MKMITKKNKKKTNEPINVLSNGYVRLVDSMGSDLSVVNAARASYAKESLDFNEKDEKLVKFLAKEGHWSPFRHAFITLEFKAPLMVARQHWKYVVGSDHTMDSWNESSRRYITMDPEFYVPDKDGWRACPENLKQGSGDFLDLETGEVLTSILENYIADGEKLYNWAIEEANVAPEQARLFLPAYGMHVVYRWSCSLQSVGLFLSQRLHHTAQYEIAEYAKAVYDIAYPLFPISIGAILESSND
jgi:thymidylate synthase (FAD)